MPYIDPVTGAYVEDSLAALPPGYNQPKAGNEANVAKMRATLNNDWDNNAPLPNIQRPATDPFSLIKKAYENMPGAGVAQAPIAALSDMLGGTIGNLYGVGKQALQGQLGNPQAGNQAYADAQRVAQAFHYEPPTQAGRDIYNAYNKVGEFTGPMPELFSLPEGRKFTPDDLRVAGRTMTQDVRNFPMDYANAKAGIQREYPTAGSVAAKATDTISDLGSGLVKPLAEKAYDMYMNPRDSEFPGINPIASTLQGLHTPEMMFAVKPKGGNFVTNLGSSLEESGSLGKYLSEKRDETPSALWKKELEGKLTRDQARNFEEIIRNHIIQNGGNQNLSIDFLNQLIDQHNNYYTLPEAQIQKPVDLEVMAEAKKNWILKNFKNYIEKQMGTGLPSDSVLAEIEKYNRPLFEQDRFSNMFGSADEDANKRRAQAVKDLQYANDQANNYSRLFKDRTYQTYDLSSPEYANVGKQTANTPAGKLFENMSDYALRSRSNVSYGNTPYGNKLNYNSRVYDLPGSYTHELGFDNILDHIDDKLLSGEYKPQDLPNKSVAAVVSDILQNRVAKEKEIGKDRDAYNKWVKDQHDTSLPIESPMLGTPPAVFPDGSKMALFDATYAKDNPDMLLRQLSVDTKDLDHCVSHCGHNTARNYKRYGPLVEPHTGVTPVGGDSEQGMRYPNAVKKGSSIIGSLRDPNGHAQATLEFNPDAWNSDYQNFKVQQIMGFEDRVVNPKYQPYVKSWLNQNADRIRFVDEDHGLKHISSFDLKEVNNQDRDFIKEINKEIPLFPEGMLNSLFNAMVEHLDTSDPGLMNAYQAGYVDPNGLFSKFLPRFFDASDLLSIANQLGVDILEHPSIMSKPHKDNAADIINQLENHRNLAEKIGDISASDNFTKLIQQVTNRVVESEQ